MEWESRTRGDHVKKLLMRVSYPYCNIGLPRSPIRFREQTMKRRGPYGAANLKFKWEEHLEKDHLNAACAALKLTLPEPFQILLHDGKTMFLRTSPLTFPNYDDIITLHRLRSSFEQYFVHIYIIYKYIHTVPSVIIIG